MPVAECAQRSLRPLELRQRAQRALRALVVAAEVEPPQACAEREADCGHGDERAVEGSCEAPKPMATTDSPIATITTRP